MCVFCDIADGSAPAHVVLEDDRCFAFLDRRPLFPGHTLLIPREHHETLPDLPAELVAPLFDAARSLAGAVPDAMGADGSLVVLNNRVSQSVAHLHVHVIPRRFKDGLRGFLWPRRPYPSESAAAETAARIRAVIMDRRR